MWANGKHHAKGHPARLDILGLGSIHSGVPRAMKGAVTGRERGVAIGGIEAVIIRWMERMVTWMVYTTVIRSFLGTPPGR